MKRRGFTLIELMAATALLLIVSMAVFSILSRSLSSTARVDNQRLLDENGKFVIESMSRFLRGVEVVSLDGIDRDGCNSDGILGSSLVVKAHDGLTSTIAISGNDLASNSAVLNSSALKVSNLNFTWRCVRGLPDELTMTFHLQPDGLSGEVDSGILEGLDYSLTIVMRNIVD
jgi:prepilin-type N-terminal cleavage/methylation domain-containing protein